MLNPSKVALVVGAALYSAGIAASVSDVNSVQPIKSDVLKEVKIPQHAIDAVKVKRSEKRKTNVLKAANQTNVQIVRSTQDKKFTWEQGVLGEQVYIVQLKDASVATYQSLKESTDEQKFARSSAKLYSNGATVLEHLNTYQRQLLAKQDSVIEAISALGIDHEVRRQFTRAVNGISIKMSQQAAQAVSKLPSIASVHRSKLYQLHTDIGPQLIGADKIWDGTVTNGTSYDGEGVIVGILDTGINTDHPSFAETTEDGYKHVNPWGAGNFAGDCSKEAFEQLCNDKLIGVYSYPVITDVYNAADYQAEDWASWDPAVQIRPANGEDYNGHGSHTAGTTAGNPMSNVDYKAAQVGDGDGLSTGFKFDSVSGVAPHANVISYQVCYPGGAGDPHSGCPGEAILSAIEDAIGDGVDVINFSIGGQESLPWDDPVEMAFLSANESGIVVSAAAGNSGLDAQGSEQFSAIDHSSPWLLNVAATTTGREITVTGKAVDEFSGGEFTPAKIEGKGISDAFTGYVVNAADYGDELCLEPFAPGTFAANNIVMCKRGDIARVAKAANVAAGGAGGFILYNAVSYGDGSELFDDVFEIPGIHVSYGAAHGEWSNDYKGLLSWLEAGSDHMATISASTISRDIDEEQADILASFSSRGPSTTNPEHLIPSIAAPGVQIYAPYADEHPFSDVGMSSDWAFSSGTSMAAPHVAGSAALLRQAHPSWSASEIQAALMMTADDVVKYQPQQWSDELAHAGIYRAGSGRVNVANAVQAGLLLNETADNFLLANPENGGDVGALNLPELVDFNCKGTCSWVRTFKATTAGNWKVVSETGEYSVRLHASPAEFSLQEGEVQSVVFTAEILDSQSRQGNAEQEVHGKVNLVSVDKSSPDMHMPVALRFDHGTLPEELKMVANRDQGSYQLKGLTLPTVTELTSRVFAPVKADIKQITMQQDVDYVSVFVDQKIYDEQGDLDPSLHIEWVEVEEGAQRFITEMISHDSSTTHRDLPWEKGDVDFIVGIDANNDGKVDIDSEAICISLSPVVDDFCNINKPDAGKYWVLAQNFRHWWEQEEAPSDTYSIATTVVGSELSSDVSIVGESVLDGTKTSDITLSWDMAMEKGDVYYSAFDLGTDAENPGNIGFVPFRLDRGENDVTIATSQTGARAGEIVDIQLHVAHNNSGMDRNIGLSTVLPEGVSLVADSLEVASFDTFDVAVDGKNITITGTQTDTRDISREYIMSTSENDPLCRTDSYGDPDHTGGYVDLAKFGFAPHYGGAWNENLDLHLGWFFGNDPAVQFYNNDAYAKLNALQVSPMGYVEFGNFGLYFPWHMRMPFNGIPDHMIAPLWRGEFFGGVLHTPRNIDYFDLENNSGITIASANSELIIEWDNARTGDYDWMTGGTIDRADSYDFQLFFGVHGTQYGPGKYEMKMAYNNLNFAGENEGVVGMKSFWGPRSSFGPIYGYLGSMFAYDDIDEKLSNDLVVCYDYTGPEVSQFDINFQVRIDDNASGNNMEINVVNQIEGLSDIELKTSIDVPGNITIGQFNDVTIAENSALEGLVIAYADANNSVNEIVVSGENVAATVTEHTPGAAIDITPTADWHGQTQVTVMVRDKMNHADMAAASFMLTVESDGIEKGCTDSSATNYDANANQDDGSCTQPASVEPETSSSFGGSMNFLLVFLLSLAGLRSIRR